MKKHWKDRNVFITGCSGLLGSWLTKYLVDGGANVTGLLRDNVPKSHLLSSGYGEKVTLVKGELENYFLIDRILNEYEIDTVFHLGAQTIVTIANSNPLSTFESNVRGTWNVLEACRKNSIKSVVVASSDKAYGEHRSLPYNEDFALKGSHPYDVSKSCSDLIASMYFKTYGLPVCITRCGNFFGPGDLNFNRIIPGTIRSVINNERPVIRSSGKMIRDYFYVKDAAMAYMSLAENIGKNRRLHGEAFNFSYETRLSVIQVVKMILEIMGKDKMKPVILNKAANEIEKQYLSCLKARKLLGWKPVFSLKGGLKETVEWYRNILR